MFTPATNEFLSQKKLKSNFLESAVLKTFIFGCSDTETREFLEINTKKYNKTLNTLFLKYQSENLFEIAYQSLNDGHLNRYDLVKDEVKEIALNYSKLVFNTYNGNMSLFLKDGKELVLQQLNLFMVDVNKSFINKAELH
jgi:hypothetical protein